MPLSHDSTVVPLTPKPHRLTGSIMTIYKTSTTRLLLFDYDGTLTPIIPHPPSAILPNQTRYHLDLLAQNPKNEVWVISGRDQAFLTAQVGNKVSLRIGLSAEHGAFLRRPNSNDWIDLRRGEKAKWREYVTGAFDKIVWKIPGSEVETKQAAVAWHYRRAVVDDKVSMEDVADRAADVAQELRKVVEQNGWKAEVVEGKCVVEVRIAGLDKGAIVKSIMSSTGKDWDFVACWGDDRTDENMFQELAAADLPEEQVFTVKVGDGAAPTSATWMLADPTEVRKCMSWLTAADRVDAEHNVVNALQRRRSAGDGLVLLNTGMPWTASP